MTAAEASSLQAAGTLPTLAKSDNRCQTHAFALSAARRVESSWVRPCLARRYRYA